MARRGVHGEMKSDLAIHHMDKFMSRKDKDTNVPLTLKEQLDALNNVAPFKERWPKSKWNDELKKQCRANNIPEKSYDELRSENNELFNSWYESEKEPNDHLVRIVKSKY